MKETWQKNFKIIDGTSLPRRHLFFLHIYTTAASITFCIALYLYTTNGSITFVLAFCITSNVLKVTHFLGRSDISYVLSL